MWLLPDQALHDRLPRRFRYSIQVTNASRPPIKPALTAWFDRRPAKCSRNRLDARSLNRTPNRFLNETPLVPQPNCQRTFRATHSLEVVAQSVGSTGGRFWSLTSPKPGPCPSSQIRRNSSTRSLAQAGEKGKCNSFFRCGLVVPQNFLHKTVASHRNNYRHAPGQLNVSIFFPLASPWGKTSSRPLNNHKVGGHHCPVAPLAYCGRMRPGRAKAP
jgi:hypothetical protein